MPHIRCMCHFGLVGKVLSAPPPCACSPLLTLHQGSYGAVFRIKYTKACQDSNSTSRSPSPPPLTCVVKRVDVQRRSFKLIMRESWFLRQLHHPNIAQLLHQYTSPNSAPNDKNPTLYFVQEDCGQTLRSYLYERIKKAEPVPLQIIDSVIQGLLSALVCLEQHGILHRDIKDDNCLISGEGSNAVAKLIDFGLAKKFDVDCLNVPPMDARQRQCDDPAMSASCEESVAAAGGAGDEDVDDQSKLFRGDRQFAPETLGMEQLKLKRQFVYKSDLWAVGVWILYPMLFWSCHSNMRKYRHPLKFDDRAAAAQFPHQELWSEEGASTTPKPYTHKHLHKVIKEKLLDKHQGGDDHHRFHTLCEVLERMYANTPPCPVPYIGAHLPLPLGRYFMHICLIRTCAGVPTILPTDSPPSSVSIT
jgi:serine/threonine protein kinase